MYKINYPSMIKLLVNHKMFKLRDTSSDTFYHQPNQINTDYPIAVIDAYEVPTIVQDQSVRLHIDCIDIETNNIIRLQAELSYSALIDHSSDLVSQDIIFIRHLTELETGFNPMLGEYTGKTWDYICIGRILPKDECLPPPFEHKAHKFRSFHKFLLEVYNDIQQVLAANDLMYLDEPEEDCDV